MVITVQCPSCQTSFPVDPRKVPEAGVHARCSRCQDVFFVERPVELLEVEPVGAPIASGEMAEATAEAAPESGGAEPETGASFAAPVVEEPAAEVEGEAGESPASAAAGSPTEVSEAPAAPEEAAPAPEEQRFEIESGDGLGSAPREAPPAEAATPPPPPAPEPAAPAGGPTSFSFGRRDPHEKARRLARVLVSDMIMYNPERHSRALESGSLKADFDEEIKKSWQEYVDQVGDEIAGSTNYFNDALNDILAKGRSVFP